MSRIKKISISSILCIIFLISSIPFQTAKARSNDFPAFIILSQYDANLDIGEELCLFAFTSNGKQAKWSSSNSKVASVNTYGIITAKKAGSAVITAKITNAEASCYLTVNKTQIIISTKSTQIERGQTFKLSATTSNHSEVSWKSSKKSIAIVDDYGNVTALKPGVTTITATADGSSAACTFTVKSPVIKLNKTSVNLYRGQTIRLSASVSSNISPSWKSNKKSVAVVDSNGTVTAMKHGTATITATVDHVSVSCQITVSKPDITLSSDEMTIKKGAIVKLTATVSSGNTPVYTSSNSNIVTINSYGEISAKQKGKAYVYATEDGTKARCTVYVTE